MAGQAAQLVPQEFNQNEKEYVTNTLLNFSTMAGEALYQDQEGLGLNVDQAVWITQIIAEWSFHKSVDLIRSGIPQQYWDSILQKIAFTIFELAKQTIKQQLPQDEILKLIEHHVRKVYLDSVAEMKEKGIIDEQLMEKASAQSNIDTVVQQMENNGEVMQEQQMPEQQPPQQPAVPAGQQTANVPAVQGSAGVAANNSVHYEPPKLLKLVTVAMLLKRMEDEEQVQEILECFEQEDAGTVIRYMYTDGIEKEVEPGATVKMLDDIAQRLPEAIEVNKKQVIERLQKVVKNFGKRQMERKLQYERHKTRQLVFNALDGEYYNVSPKIANIIATYLENVV